MKPSVTQTACNDIIELDGVHAPGGCGGMMGAREDRKERERIMRKCICIDSVLLIRLG